MHSYAQHADQDRLRQRIIELNAQQRMDGEIAYILNAEGFRTAHGPLFSGGMIHQLRKRWQIVTIKINGLTTVDEEFDQVPRDGLLGWQMHFGELAPTEVIFRNVQIRALPALPPPEDLD